MIARIITKEKTDDLIKYLKKEKCGVTIIDAKGIKGNVKILFTVVKRKKLDMIYEAIDKYTPDSFVSVEDVKSVSEDRFVGLPFKKKRLIRSFKSLRKGK